MKKIKDVILYQTQAVCPACESNHLGTSDHVEILNVVDKNNRKIDVPVSIQVHTCHECGFSFTSSDSDELRNDAVCKAMGVMTPREILAIREHYNLSQSEFSSITGIGKASLARWEGGLLIQNKSNDNLLYLLSFDENIQRLGSRNSLNLNKNITSNSNVVQFRPKFRAIEAGSAKLNKQAERFQLYCDSESMVG